MKHPAWVDIFASYSEKTACVGSVTSDKNMHAKVQHFLSDELISKKSKARNAIFDAL